MRPLANFFAVQVGWFASVLGAAHGYPWLGPLVVSTVVILHLAAALRPEREARLLAIAMVTGVGVDSLFVITDCLHYTNGQLATWLAPVWIITMWPLFATTLNASLRWLRDRTMLAVVLGALAGPASYLGGAALGAVTLSPGPAPLIIIGACWALVFPALLWLARRFDGLRTGPLPGNLRDWIGNS
jgi:hypothetical protein